LIVEAKRLGRYEAPVWSLHFSAGPQRVTELVPEPASHCAPQMAVAISRRPNTRNCGGGSQPRRPNESVRRIGASPGTHSNRPPTGSGPAAQPDNQPTLPCPPPGHATHSGNVYGLLRGPSPGARGAASPTRSRRGRLRRSSSAACCPLGPSTPGVRRPSGGPGWRCSRWLWAARCRS
jgi:hypothetical protein